MDNKLNKHIEKNPFHVYPKDNELKKHIEKNPFHVYAKLLDFAAKNEYMSLTIHSMEKFNLSEPFDAPKDDGSFDIEGHSSVDIYGSYNIYPFTVFDDFMFLLKSIKEWIIDSIEFKSLRFLLKSHPFKRKRDQWVFVVDSFNSIKNDMIWNDETIEAVLSGKMSTDAEELKKATDNIDEKKVHDYLMNTGYTYNGDGFYVSQSDPGCIVIDNNKHQFDMKSGWSDKKTMLLISKYFTDCGYPVKIKYETRGEA